MGDVISVCCSKCGAERKYCCGVGMSYFDIRNIMWDLPESMQKDIEKALAAKGAKTEECSSGLYHCRSCHAVKERLYFKIRKGGGKIVSPRYRCGRCDVPLRRVEPPRITELPCTRCGSRSLEVFGTGHWD